MRKSTCVAIMAINRNGQVTDPSMVMVTNDAKLWLSQTLATLEHIVERGSFHFEPNSPSKKLYSLLEAQLDKWQTGGNGVGLDLNQPFSFEGDEARIGGIVRCFRPEEGPYAIRLPLSGSRHHVVIGGFASRASVFAWVLNIESALNSVGVPISGKDWYQILPE